MTTDTAPPKKLKLLLIEDDPEHIEQARRDLAKEWDVTVCDTWAIYRQILSEGRQYDLVIADSGEIGHKKFGQEGPKYRSRSPEDKRPMKDAIVDIRRVSSLIAIISGAREDLTSNFATIGIPYMDKQWITSGGPDEARSHIHSYADYAEYALKFFQDENNPYFRRRPESPIPKLALQTHQKLLQLRDYRTNREGRVLTVTPVSPVPTEVKG